MKNIIKKDRVKLPYIEKSLERDSINFKWRSKTEGFRVPFQPEMIITINGSLGWDKVHNVWVTGSFENIRDEYGDYTIYICHTLNTENIQNYQLKNHEEVIVCGNTPLYRSFNQERRFYADFKEETDKSILCQLLNSRLNKALIADTDKKAEQIRKAFDAIELGKPVTIVTSLLDGVETIDLTDSSEIEKMQYLSGFYGEIEKRESNDAGVDLERVDKRAQISTEELRQYDDITTLEYLIMYEMRQNFVEEMRENGIEIEIVRNPVFFDEPTSRDIDTGEFRAAEVSDDQEPENETININEDETEDTENGN